MAKKPKKTKAEIKKNEKTITNNRKARYNYAVEETLECGIVLVGSEVKSLRAQNVTIDESYARIKEDEVWIVNMDIGEYSQANVMNHEPRRWRKLLMHKREFNKFASQAKEQQYTLVPLKMYFKHGKVKVLLGLCKGKKQHDKRETMKKRTVKRDLDRAMKSS